MSSSTPTLEGLQRLEERVEQLLHKVKTLQEEKQRGEKELGEAQQRLRQREEELRGWSDREEESRLQQSGIETRIADLQARIEAFLNGG